MAIVDRLKFNGGPDDIAWKFPDEGITWGAQLIVAESQEAVFFKGGQCHDLFGPGTYTLKSNNIPLLEKNPKLKTKLLDFLSKAAKQGVEKGVSQALRLN